MATRIRERGFKGTLESIFERASKRLRKARNSSIHLWRQAGKCRFFKDYMLAYRAHEHERFREAVRTGKTVEQNCPVCGETGDAIPLTNANGNTYKACETCDITYMSPILEEEALTEIYRHHSETPKSFFWGHSMARVRKSDVKASNHPSPILAKHVPGGKLLEIGCGTGEFLRKAQAFYECSGIEIDPKTSAFARDELGLDIVTGDIMRHQLPYSREFDVIALFQVIEHIPNPKALLEKIEPLIRFGGYLLIECPNRRSLSLRLLGRWHVLLEGNEHITFFSRNSLRLLLESSGYNVVDCETFKSDMNLFDWLGHKCRNFSTFVHRYSHRGFLLSVILSPLIKHFDSRVQNRMAEDPDAGSYVRVLAQYRGRTE